MTSFQLLVTRTHKLAEGPLYQNQSYFWVDINAGELHQVNKQQHHSIASFDDLVTSVVVTEDNEKLISLSNRFLLIDKDENPKNIDFNIELPPNTRFNDAKVDPWGNYWIGSMDLNFKEPLGSLYCITTKGDVIKMLKHVTCSNGLCWDEKLSTFYYIDSIKQTIVAYYFNSNTYTLSEARVIYREKRAQVYPDGMCIDENGNLWVALWGGFEVIQINPRLQQIMTTLNFPCPNISSCCFSGTELKTLLVTTASVDTDLNSASLAGKIFLVDVTARGLISNTLNVSRLL